jgi:hypothetical protein
LNNFLIVLTYSLYCSVINRINNMVINSPPIKSILLTTSFYIFVVHVLFSSGERRRRSASMAEWVEVNIFEFSTGIRVRQISYGEDRDPLIFFKFETLKFINFSHLFHLSVYILAFNEKIIFNEFSMSCFLLNIKI